MGFINTMPNHATSYMQTHTNTHTDTCTKAILRNKERTWFKNNDNFLSYHQQNAYITPSKTTVLLNGVIYLFVDLSHLLLSYL